jgi:NADP-dependent 3-hydroxy acid dehydrogenase YdfG
MNNPHCRYEDPNACTPEGKSLRDRAKGFADGATIALIGRDAIALEQAAGPLGAQHAVADVTDPAALRNAIVPFGRCDILVNNAGATILKPFAKHQLHDFQVMLEVNLSVRGHACQAVLSGMRAQRFGRIINVSVQPA